MHAEVGQRPVGPGARRDHQPAAAVDHAARRHLDLAARGPDPLDRRAVAQRRAVRPRHPHVRRVAPRRHRDAALGLVQAVDVVGHRELRPAAADLRRVEVLVGDAGRVHAAAVVGERDGALARREVEPAGLEHELLAGILLHLGPGAVGVLGQLDVARRVIGEPDDARVVLRLAAHVAQLELLEPQHAGAGPAREPVGRGAAPAAEPEDDVLVVAPSHVVPPLVQPLPDIPPDVEAPALHRRVIAGLEDPRRHPALDRLADHPVLPVHQVPELHRVGRVEVRPGHLVRMEQELVDDGRAVGAVGQTVERRHVLGAQAEQEVGIDQLALVAGPLVVVQPREREPVVVPLAVKVQAPSRWGCPAPSRARSRRAA